MLKAYRYRIYPNKEQADMLNRHIGHCRFVWNWALGKKTETYQQTGKSITRFQLQAQLPIMKKTEEFAWLSEVNSLSLQATLEILEKTFTGFFRDKKGYPKFKSKRNDKQSFSIPQNTVVDFEQGKISIPKVKDIKAKLHRKFEGKVKTCTISRNTVGQYFISIFVDNQELLPTKKPLDENQAIGFDLGIKQFLVASNGDVVANPRHLKTKIVRLKFLQKELSRKVKGSSNRDKVRKRVAKLHLKISNSRLDFLHQTTSRLVKSDYNTFCIEDLSVSNMVRNHKLAQAISDVSWSKFLEILTYKCDWYGKNIIKIGRFDASSQICSGCGYQNRQVKDLAIREWTCPSCKANHDRDINASKNILRFAFVKHNTGLERPVELVDSATLDDISSNTVLKRRHYKTPTKIVSKGKKQEAQAL